MVSLKQKIPLKLFFLLLLPLLAASCSPKTQTPIPMLGLYNHQLQIGDQTLLVRVASDDASRAKGLSGTISLKDNQGMLFDFRDAKAKSQLFWMKDMNFDLDFIWIKQNRVVGITPNVPKPTADNAERPPLYESVGPVDMVLEVNSGWAEVHHITTGAIVALKN